MLQIQEKRQDLCTLFPEMKAFTVLVTLGKKEIDDVKKSLASLNRDTQKIFAEARQFHDGKWIYKRVLNKSDLDDIQSLITIRKKHSPAWTPKIRAIPCALYA